MRRAFLTLLLGCGLMWAAPVLAATPGAVAGVSGNWPSQAQSNPAELMRQASQNELERAFGYRGSLRYELRKITAKSDTTKEIVETKTGAVARLIAIDGRPLSVAQQGREIDRLQSVAADPAIEEHRRRAEARDNARIKKFLRLMPDAFLYEAAGTVETRDGTMVRLTFRPNPKFSPPDLESHVLRGIRGEVLIDPQQKRIVKIQGRIFTTVDFGWGVLGVLYPGGTMLLEQSKTAKCGWQLTRMSLHLDGKALIFKTLHITLEETAKDYRPIPRSWTYQDAVQWLLHKFAETS